MSKATVPVSVAIPVYNGMPYLREAIESVLAQTVTPQEFGVFDNASTDGSAPLASELLGSGSLVESPTNLGAIANFNRAAHAASQPYFMWLGADDRLAPSFIERALSILEESPEAPACLTGVQFIDGAGQPTYVQLDRELASATPRPRLRAFLRRRRWTEFYCLYRTDALRRSPLVLPVHGSDVLLTWWFLVRGPLAVTDELLLEYRVHTTRNVEDVTEAITPGAPRTHWLKVRMWAALWRMAGEPDVPARVRRTARQELALLPFSVAWWFHLAEDVTLRWPWLRRQVSRVITLPTSAKPRSARR